MIMMLSILIITYYIMPVPAFMEPIVNYYILYGPMLIIASLVLGITYLFISNFSAVRSAYLCTSLKNVVTGEVGKCFSSRIGATCKSSDIGFTHGWCNDEDNYGPLRGTRAGPHSVKCRDWIWNKRDCPPENCASVDGMNWGWCADKGVQRAMRGQACGPYAGSCDNWVWNKKACPTQCGSPSCTDDSCICTMVKARYIILKRVDGKKERINIKNIEVYDSNGFRIKGFRTKIWPKDEDSDKSIIITQPSSQAYIQLDLNSDKPIGRIVIRNRTDCCDDRIMGCAMVLRKDSGATVLYRKITERKPVYNIPIGNAKPIASAINAVNAIKAPESVKSPEQLKTPVKAPVKSPYFEEAKVGACRTDRDKPNGPIGYSGYPTWEQSTFESAEACEAKCISDKMCKGYAWAADKKNCQLYGTTTAKSPGTNTVDKLVKADGTPAWTCYIRKDQYVPQPVKGRYIRINRANNGSFLNLSDISVYGPNNTKITGITPSLSPQYGIFAAKYLIDGNAKTIAHTNNTPGAYMQLDLGADKEISRIVITNRLDCCKERIKNATVQIKNQSNTEVFSYPITTILNTYDITVPPV
jgi:hypothetical protein